MERRNRNILVLLIAVVMIVAVVASFGMSLFTGGTVPIVLPAESGSPDSATPPDASGQQDDLLRVEVTPDTVQSVIATLKRPDSYYRTVTIDDYWGPGTQGRTVAKVWVSDGWTQVEATNAAGLVRTSLVGEGHCRIRYGSGNELTLPADHRADDLEGQRIPTYEDVLQLDRDFITATGYEEKAGQPCILVESRDPELSYRERYWVSADHGLLVAAETWDEGELVYSMLSDYLERPCPPGVLPEQ